MLLGKLACAVFRIPAVPTISGNCLSIAGAVFILCGEIQQPLCQADPVQPDCFSWDKQPYGLRPQKAIFYHFFGEHFTSRNAALRLATRDNSGARFASERARNRKISIFYPFVADAALPPLPSLAPEAL